ncbi:MULTISPECIES: sulfotransferase domain-containing protein [unclassified Moorena]|uniref:sulfotransferase domain-containing protein n=1 Tax=unclassified Moorena TaxID=2683338 RepID=UPI0013FEC1D9|nr:MULTISPECIES: sulfotransferase domain-containing protein [unclassified Moorena]NEO14139.1 sulfotransferase domain-containing protein [Moorena sp. SIO3E8]NEQ00651.1 sulfotransferase domain-containing protein [Moorena sp. SIO3F7]
MIIYIASYPRSGNSLTQQTIQTFFERPMTVVYGGSRKPETYASGAVNFIKNWRWPKDKTISKSLWGKLHAQINKNNLENWIALYDLNVPPYTKDCRYLLPGCLSVLTPKNRQKLAAEESPFFIKTHELPYQEYFEGEYVILAVRHPGSVLWSYFNFIKDFWQDVKTLDEVIRGEVTFGSWSEWYQSWNQAIPSLNDRLLRLRFEDVLADRRRACQQIKALISLDYNPSKQELSFEELHKKDPQHIRSGKANGWEKYYTDNQLSLLWELHSATMQQFGYEMPK